MTTLTPLIIQNAATLRHLADDRGGLTPTDVARDLGRDPSNFAKALAALRREGLAHPQELRLSPAGVDAVAALDRADGPPAPDGFTTLRHDQIAPDPDNPRKTFDEAELDELRDAIVTHGALLQNLVVRAPVAGFGVRMLVAGERRWRAIGVAIERGELPADWPIPVKVEKMDAAEARVAAIIENGQRVDVPPLEEASAFQRLIDLDDHTPASIAAIIGKSARHVQLRLALLKLDGEGQADLTEGRISLAQARQMVTEPRVAPPTSPAGPSAVPETSAERKNLSGSRPNFSAPERSEAAPPAFEIVKANRDERQAQVAAWCARSFGEAHAASLPQRGVRLLEEAIELAQAAGVESEMAARLVAYVYARDVGEIAQEIGGVSVTLLALAHAAGLSANGEEVREVSRVLAKPRTWFAERNAMKNAAGFDALARPEGDQA